MNTSNPFSTISYNSIPFLEGVLNDLIESELIDFWCFIKHDGEHIEDEGYETEEKDHIHLFVSPNGRMNTVKFCKRTLEPDPDPAKIGKFLKCIDCRPSKWADWLWYCLHDETYLISKAMKRQFKYSKEDFHYSDEDEFNERFSRGIHEDVMGQRFRIRNLMKEASVNQLAALGVISPNEAFSYLAYDKMVRAGQTELENYQNHKRMLDEFERRRQLEKPIDLDPEQS